MTMRPILVACCIASAWAACSSHTKTSVIDPAATGPFSILTGVSTPKIAFYIADDNTTEWINVEAVLESEGTFSFTVTGMTINAAAVGSEIANAATSLHPGALLLGLLALLASPFHFRKIGSGVGLLLVLLSIAIQARAACPDTLSITVTFPSQAVFDALRADMVLPTDAALTCPDVSYFSTTKPPKCRVESANEPAGYSTAAPGCPDVYNKRKGDGIPGARCKVSDDCIETCTRFRCTDSKGRIPSSCSGAGTPRPTPKPATGPTPGPVSPGDGSSCPSGFKPAIGTLYDSWPKPGTKECIEYSGCRWAGMFSTFDGGSCPSCKNGAQCVTGGSGTQKDCRFPPEWVAAKMMAATWEKYPALRGKTLDVLVQGKSKTVRINVADVCADSDCENCCSKNTGNNKYPLLDLEKNPASQLLGFSFSSSSFDINDVSYAPAGSKRGGLQGLPLCYREV